MAYILVTLKSSIFCYGNLRSFLDFWGLNYGFLKIESGNTADENIVMDSELVVEHNKNFKNCFIVSYLSMSDIQIFTKQSGFSR